jgi:hypothetical protein
LEAFVGGYSVVVKDAPPFAIIRVIMQNVTALKDRPAPWIFEEAIEKLHHAYHLFSAS